MKVMPYYRTDLTEKQWQIIKKWIPKQKNGRKRHIVVDTLGLIMALVVHAADIQDQAGAKFAIEELGERFKRLKVIFADAAYKRNGLPDWVKQCFGWPNESTLCKRLCDRWVSRAL